MGKGETGEGRGGRGERGEGKERGERVLRTGKTLLQSELTGLTNKGLGFIGFRVQGLGFRDYVPVFTFESKRERNDPERSEEERANGRQSDTRSLGYDSLNRVPHHAFFSCFCQLLSFPSNFPKNVRLLHAEPAQVLLGFQRLDLGYRVLEFLDLGFRV